MTLWSRIFAGRPVGTTTPPVVLAENTDRSFQIAPDGTVSLSGTWDARFVHGALDAQLKAIGRERGRQALAWQREHPTRNAKGQFSKREANG